jgi:hypothetical protein
MFRFELTRKEDGQEVTTYGQLWDTRRDAAFHAMLAHKLTLAQFNHLTNDSHGPLPVTDGAMLEIKGKDTTPAARPAQSGGTHARACQCRICKEARGEIGPQVNPQWITRPSPTWSAAEIEDVLRSRPASGTFDPAYPQPTPEQELDEPL